MSELRVVLFVPLIEELKYVHALMIKRGAKASLPFSEGMDSYEFVFRTGTRNERKVAVRLIGDMGNLTAATRMAPLVVQEKPQIAILVGLAGGLDGVRLGDVVVAAAVKALYPDKIKKISPATETLVAVAAPNTPGVPGAYRLDERKRFMGDNYFRFRRHAVYLRTSMAKAHDYVRALADRPFDDLQPILDSKITGLPMGAANDAPTVHYGVVFGSDMVIDSQDYLDFVTGRNGDTSWDYYTQREGRGDHARAKWFASDLKVVDMETLGFLEMVKALSDVLPNMHAFSVRGVSDMAANKQELDEDTGDDVRDVAVNNAARVAVDLIEQLDRLSL